MKYILMCEGANELEIINILLENNKLKLNRDDLLGLVPYHARQLDKCMQIQTVWKMYTDKAIIYRIGDKLSDVLRVPKDFKKWLVCVEKYCTLPELEILLIISEGKYQDYIKNKSQIRAKEYAKKNICYNRKWYDNSSSFYREYYKNPDKLISAINEYYRLHKSHKKDEGYLAELLK